MSNGWSTFSNVLGWIGFAAWSISFYPQLIINWRRKSVEGLSIDFFSLNPLGFACYTVYNIALYASPTVRRQYSERHHGHYPQAQLNDIAFAVHALAFSLVTLVSIFVYRRDPKQRLSSFNRGVLAFLVSSIVLGTLLVTTNKLAALDLVLWLSYIKLYISTTKMIPQAWINYRRKSTVGWSIENILLDFTGGVLSLAQLVIDSWVDGDLHGIIGNPGKLGLGLLALGFDMLFMLQHFVLYRNAQTELDHRADGTTDGVDRDRTGARRSPRRSAAAATAGAGEREALLPAPSTSSSRPSYEATA